MAKLNGIKGWPPYLASYHVDFSHDLKCPDWRIQMVQHVLSQGNGNYKIDRGTMAFMSLLSYAQNCRAQKLHMKRLSYDQKNVLIEIAQIDPCTKLLATQHSAERKIGTHLSVPGTLHCVSPAHCESSVA